MLINDLIVISINRVNYIEWALLNSKFEITKCSRYIHPQLHRTKHVRSRIGSVTVYMNTVTFLKRKYGVKHKYS